MGLLAPWLLALAGAVVVPIALHLFHRQQGPRVVFPALRYLRRAEKEHARRIRLKQLLLLALRVTAILLLALAAARPYVRAGGAGHAPTAVVLVLDNSLSSGAVVGERRVLDTLKERALATLAAAGPDDRFWLLRAGEPWATAQAGDAATVAREVRQTDVSAAAADIAGALRRARAILDAGAEGRAREIQLLSDLQATGLPAATGADPGAPPVVAWTPSGTTPANAGVVAVQLGGGFAPRAGERTIISGRVLGGRDSLPVRLVVGGRAVAAAVVDTPGDFSLALTAGAPGLLLGHVEVDPDALRGDDRRWFAAEVRPPPGVALAQPAPFLDEALDVLAGASRLRRAPLDAADIVLAPGGAGVAAAVRDGHAVVVLPPDSEVELPALDRRLADAGIPWRLGAASGAGEARFGALPNDPELAAALAEARIRTFYALSPATPQSGDTVLLRLAGGEPWLVRGETASGARYLVAASPLTTDATTLPTSAALIPLLDRMLGPWTTRGAPVHEAVVGDAVPLGASASTLVRPDGRIEQAEGGASLRLTEPGIYRVMAGDSLLDVIAANAPAAETPLRRLSARELEQRLAGWDVHTVGDAADWRRAIFRSRYGYQLALPLLLAALLVLLTEALVAASGRRPATRPAPTPGPRTENAV